MSGEATRKGPPFRRGMSGWMERQMGEGGGLRESPQKNGVSAKGFGQIAAEKSLFSGNSTTVVVFFPQQKHPQLY